MNLIHQPTQPMTHKRDGKIYITYVDFYDSQEIRLAKGVTETPLSKERDEILVLNFQHQVIKFLKCFKWNQEINLVGF